MASVSAPPSPLTQMINSGCAPLLMLGNLNREQMGKSSLCHSGVESAPHSVMNYTAVLHVIW